MNRRGTTLIELMIGLVLLAMLGVAITQTLAAATRAATRSVRGLNAARTLMSTGSLLREEIGSSGSNEVTLSASTAFDFGRSVGSGSVCEVVGPVVMVRTAEWRGVRLPEEGRDQAVLLTNPLAATWTTHSIDSVSSGHCPDGTAAIRLVVPATPGSALFLRVTEPVRLRGYLSSGDGWWGLAPASGLSPVQPFAGPLVTPLQSIFFSPAIVQLHFRPAFGLDALLSVPLGPP